MKNHKETYFAVKIGKAHPYFMLSELDKTIPGLFQSNAEALRAADKLMHNKFKIVEVEITEL